MILARIENTNGKISTSTSEEPFSQVKYAWYNDKDKQTNGNQLRQNDIYYIVFPYDQSGGGIAFGSFDGSGRSFSSHSERLLNLLENHYNLELSKIEEKEASIYPKKQSFDVSTTTTKKE